MAGDNQSNGFKRKLNGFAPWLTMAGAVPLAILLGWSVKAGAVGNQVATNTKLIEMAAAKIETLSTSDNIAALERAELRGQIKEICIRLDNLIAALNTKERVAGFERGDP